MLLSEKIHDWFRKAEKATVCLKRPAVPRFVKEMIYIVPTVGLGMIFLSVVVIGVSIFMGTWPVIPFAFALILGGFALVAAGVIPLVVLEFLCVMGLVGSE